MPYLTLLTVGYGYVQCLSLILEQTHEEHNIGQNMHQQGFANSHLLNY
jgi:hypothetical protein